MKPKKKISWRGVLTAFIFVLCLLIGYWLSQRKPLWNDEIYTQIYTIDAKTYGDILFVRFSEGSTPPLFYLIQKGICDLFRYKFPLPWHQEWNLSDPWSQAVLRLSSNIFMSLSVTLIFYFFARFYSGWVGVYSLLICLSSYIVWAYWVEARPYSLWFLLTTVQCLLFLRIVGREEVKTSGYRHFVPGDSGNGGMRHIWNGLVATHILLSFTVILSVWQISIVSFLLWAYKEKDWRRHILLAVIPLGVCASYYFHSSITRSIIYYRLDTPMQLIYANFPPDRMLIFLSYAFFAGFYYFQKKTRPIKLYEKDMPFRRDGYLAMTALTLLAAFAMLAIFKIRTAPAESPFTISERYFIYLAPVGIIGTTLFSVRLIRVFKGNLWLFVTIAMALGGLGLIRFLRTFLEISTAGLY